MALARPTFNSVVASFPDPSLEVGVTHGCAIRMSLALAGAITGFLDGYTGHLHRGTLTIAGSLALANYLESAHVGWTPLRPRTRAAAEGYSGRQGIIFWHLVPDARQITLREAAQERRIAAAAARSRTIRRRAIRASPDHIDLWDPAMTSLPGMRGLSMTWVPEPYVVASIRFWELPVRG